MSEPTAEPTVEPQAEPAPVVPDVPVAPDGNAFVPADVAPVGVAAAADASTLTHGYNQDTGAFE